MVRYLHTNPRTFPFAVCFWAMTACSTSLLPIMLMALSSTTMTSPIELLRALISRRLREPAHLVDCVPAQAEHPRCFPLALTLNKNKLPDRGVGFHGGHPRLTLPNRKRSAYPLAGFCSAMQQHPAAAPQRSTIPPPPISFLVFSIARPQNTIPSIPSQDFVAQNNSSPFQAKTFTSVTRPEKACTSCSGE
jgi:hypothetical protein